MSPPVLIIGAGGHGRVLSDAVRACGHQVLGFLDADDTLHGKILEGVPVLGGDDLLASYSAQSVALINGIGTVSSSKTRREAFRRLSALGFRFATVCHPSAVVSRYCALSSGVQVMARAVIQVGVAIGENSIVNTGAQLDHDCRIGAHCHVAPGAVLAGSVSIGDDTHIGAGAIVLQGVSIGSGALIAAGAVVIRSVPHGARVAGVPARHMNERQSKWP